ncbi:MAG TPA: cell division protein FtsH [Planctomycetaceae bacterium]|nr:cell division protein FtsH [Planctomycetaceae bacterium]
MAPNHDIDSTGLVTPDAESVSGLSSSQISELIATAYHEAGHAVMAAILGRNIQKVTIKAGQIQTGGVRLGVCELASGRRRASNDALQDEVLILLAGMVAEAKFTGRYCKLGASQDLRHVASLLHERGGNEKQAERLQRRMLDKAEHLLNVPAHWQAITLVAKELIERKAISGRSVRHFVSQSLSRRERAGKPTEGHSA